LKPLRYGICTNPIDWKYAPMNLFWRSEVAAIAEEKFIFIQSRHGSLEELRAEQKARRIRREVSKKKKKE
jgi:hypothetical protein